MIIQSDQIRMGARRNYSSVQATYSGSLRWNRIRQHADTDRTTKEDSANSGTSNLKSRDDLMEQMNAASGVRRLSIEENLRAFKKIQQQTLDYLLYTLFGRPPENTDFSTADNSGENFSDLLSQTASQNQSPSDLFQTNGQYYSYFYYNEQETTCFDASGTAVTADGRTIPFSISLEMSRSFTEIAEQQIDFNKPRLCDPLVINLDSNIANVSDQKFLFDIDADGKEDSISMLNSGSGYLALDKNEDGKINDGSELFGTTNGNGFQELAAYDKDGNGWIDEADEIFSMLRIWTKDINGNDQLLTLKEAGVGAIYLGYEDTNFSLNNMTDNATNAVIRKSGVFLYENGASGTVQQLDLAT